MTEKEKAEINKMIKQAVDEAILQIRQEIVNARRTMDEKVQDLEKRLRKK
jgi:hypothetical protein